MGTSKVLKPRRGSTAEHASFKGQAFEITFDTDKKTIVAHDGLTVGGFPLAHESAIIEAAEALRAFVDQKLSEVESVSPSDLTGLESALKSLINANTYQQAIKDADQDSVINVLDSSLRALIAEQDAVITVVQNTADAANAGLVGVVRSVNGVNADAEGNVALKAVIIQTWVSGTSWYRKWSDGWIEQGGQVSASANSQTTVTLPTAMGTSNYTTLLTHYGTSLEDSHPFKAGTRTTSSFKIVNTQEPSMTVGWIVMGK